MHIHVPLFDIYALFCIKKSIWLSYVRRLCSLCITGRALTLDAAFSALHSVCHKWFRIGLLLGVPTFRLEIIMTDRLSTEERMLTMLGYWMSNGTDPLPSWEVLVNALKAPTVGESGLAWALEERYCSPADQSSLGKWEAI